MNVNAAPMPAHQQVYEALRARVLYGELAPGSAVTIQGIADDLGAGMTPVREALRRLVAEGALALQGNRRVSVPVLTPADIDEIDHLRHAVEPELARRAARHTSAAALERLRAIDSDLDQAIAGGDVAAYLERNHRFHAELHHLARAPILRDVAEGLWLRFGPSMRVVCGRIGTASLPDQHKALLAALAAADEQAVARAMHEDVAQGIDQLRLSLSEND